MNGQFKKTMKVQARKGLLLMLCFLLLPVMSLIAPGGVAQAEPAVPEWIKIDTDADQSFYKIIFVDGVYLAVGNGGQIYRSYNGKQWESVVYFDVNSSPELTGVSYLNNRYFIYGQEGIILSWANGEVWELSDLDFEAETHDMAFFDNLYYAVGRGETILESSDGMDWTVVSTTYQLDGSGGGGGGGIYTAVASNDDIIVVFDEYGGTRYRLAGHNAWIVGQSLDDKVNAAVYQDGLFMAVGDDGFVYTSVDGIQWNVQQIEDADDLYGVRFIDGLFVVVGKNGLVKATGNNGQNWLSWNVEDGLRVYDIAFGTAGTFIVGSGGAIYRNGPFEPDPENWLSVETETDSTLHKVIYADGHYVAVGEQGVIAYSADGETWASDTPSQEQLPYRDLWALFYQNGSYFAAGQGGIIMSASDLADWSRIRPVLEDEPEPTYNYYDFIAAGETSFMIVGSHEAQVIYDEDEYYDYDLEEIVLSKEWMNITLPGRTNVFRGIVSTEDIQVAVGEDMTLFYLEAPDDTRAGEDDPGLPSWEAWDRQGTSGLDLYGVAASPEALVAVGENGKVFRSVKGKTWTEITSITEETLRSVRWIDDRFYAVGDGGTLISSEDGIEWKAHLLVDKPSFDFYDIVKGIAGMMIVGKGGEALRQDIVRVESIALNGEGLLYDADTKEYALTLTDKSPAVVLTADVLPQNALNKQVIWTSSNENVAEVEDGAVTQKAIGTAVITATTVDGLKTAVVNVSVESSDIPVRGVTLNRDDFSLDEEQTFQLEAIIDPSNATEKGVDWESSDESFVKVEDGLVTAISKGTATITATTWDGNETASVIITVLRPVTSVKVTPAEDTLYVGGDGVQLSATVEPEGATGAKIEWISEDESVATVSEHGVVQPVSRGIAVIRAEVENETYGTATITVLQPVTSIKLRRSTLELDEDQIGTLIADVLPSDASNAEVEWISSNPLVAEVEGGVVTAISKGTATITAKAADGSPVSDFATVTVIRRVSGLTVSHESLSLNENGSPEQLKAKILPADANETRVNWRSLDKNVATVDENGLVRPYQIGSTTIVVTTQDNPELTDTVNVTVSANRANDVTLNAYARTMKQGGAPFQLIATVWPSNASDKRVTWESSRPDVATVVDGLVTPVGHGKAIITVKTVDGGDTRQATITVEQTIWPVTGVKLDKPTLELTVGGANGQLTATVAPDNATNKAVQWSSSKPEVATVDSNGIIKPVSAGTTVVTVTTADGERTASTTVTVKAANPPQQPGTPGGGGGFGGGAVAPPAANPTEEITVSVDGGTGSANLSTFTIKRTAGEGTKQDAVTLEAAKTKEAADKAKAAGLPILRVLIPDARDEVSETSVTLPAGALESLRGSELGVELSTVNARLVIGSETLAEQREELYFRLKPLKTASEHTQLQGRAGAQQVVQAAVGAGTFEVVGRPVTIETNMKGHRVEIVLPLAAELVPVNTVAREAWLSRLMIFIEHSDGERVLVQPQVVTDSAGRVGLSFEVTKFSTFSILEIEAADVPATVADGSHKAYMNGYEDGSFRPSREVTRAELAAILSRLYPMSATDAAASEPTDIATHWAAAPIRAVVAAGYMQGYPEGAFQPDRVLSRAEIAAILSRIEGLTHSGTATFGDVASGHWAEGYIAAVAQAGLMTGYDGQLFKPGQGVTRAETVVIFNRLLRRGPLTGISQPTWSDVSASHWAFGHIEEASREHAYSIIDGQEVLFQP